MYQARAEAEERCIISARSSSIRGTARVRIRSIQLGSRDISRGNVERLKEVFDTVGCARLEPKNHVPVLVTEEDLRFASMNPGVGDPYPSLEFRDGALKCLHRRHRLLAASEYLDPVDQWWIVEFYVDGIESVV